MSCSTGTTEQLNARKGTGDNPITPTNLLSLVLTLRPQTAADDLPHLGRAVHAILLDAASRHDPVLAEALHDGSTARPFTASGLIGYNPRYPLNPEYDYTIRLTALTAPLASALLEAATTGSLSTGETLQLAEWGFDITAAATSPDEHPWAASTSYEQLSAPWLLARERPDSRIDLQFASPTTFKSGGMHVPVPLPALVFGSLLERWNTFAPVTLPEEMRRFAGECLALSRYELRTQMVTLKNGGKRAGALGSARYSALNRDRYWLSLTSLLADFALFAGVGAGTSMGLGQVRRQAGR